MLTAAFVTFIAVAALADWQGPGHDWAGLAVLTGWFFLCRTLTPRGWHWLWTAAMVFSVAVAALAVAQVILWMPRARGPFASPNFLGAYAVLMFFLAAAGKSFAGTCVAHMAAAASLLSVALSQSRGALMALGAGLIVMAWGSRRLHLWASLAAVAAICVIPLVRSDTTNPRLEIWWLGWQAAQQRLLLGWGQGGVSISGLNSFYSIPLEWLLASGILGVAAGTWLLCVAWRDAKGQPAIHAFLAAWFVQGLVLFGHPATYIPLVAVLAYLAHRSSIAATSTPDIVAVPETMARNPTSIQ